MGEVDVKLDRSALPGSTHRITEFEVELWSIEGPIAFVDTVFVPGMLTGFREDLLTSIPEFLFPDIIVWTGGKDDIVA